MIRAGDPAQLGATPDSDGTNFALHSDAANSVELCLYDNHGTETRRYRLPECRDGVWHGYLPGCAPGQLYGYRVHGDYAPDSGLRCNPHKLLIDPYARALRGEFRWHPAVFDYATGEAGEWQINALDSGPYVPKCVVTNEQALSSVKAPRIPWAQSIFYELNVRGYTMRHPDVPAADRGRFAGLTNAAVLDYLRALGVTSIEIMPVHWFIDEQALHARGLRNLWGYNSINFFAPANRYATANASDEFRAMTDAIHSAGMEVILDVAYNHTGESDRFGPTLSMRGIDNLSYYKTTGPTREYINDTGCGNTLDADSTVVQRLIVDSLRYWARDMGVDGFRFDLATVLGRHDHGFSRFHPLLQAINTDPLLRDRKLIAEPWDPGPGGYQLGGFPAGWAEWNDRYRDSVRRFWRSDEGTAGEFARRVHGSADIFEPEHRDPAASINFVSSHDGFSLADTVAFEQRHNLANGEDNRDGHAHNYSCNHGTEGETADPLINARRRRQRLNMLATVLLSQGTPMLLGGDEFGNSQSGNNNVYAQDNPTGWVDWSGLDADPAFTDSVRQLIRLRRSQPLLRSGTYLHGEHRNGAGWPDIDWRAPDSGHLSAHDWHNARAFCLLLARADAAETAGDAAVAVLFNASSEATEFILAAPPGASRWKLVFTSGEEPVTDGDITRWSVGPQMLVCLLMQPEPPGQG